MEEGRKKKEEKAEGEVGYNINTKITPMPLGWGFGLCP